MIFPPVQPGQPQPQPRSERPRVGQGAKPRDQGFRGLLDAALRTAGHRSASASMPRAGASGEAHGRARIFNEDGFFGSARSPFSKDREDAAAPLPTVASLGRAPRSSLAGEVLPGPAPAGPEPRPAGLADKGGPGPRSASYAGGAEIAGMALQAGHGDRAIAPAPLVPHAAASEAAVEASAESAPTVRGRNGQSSAAALLNIMVRLVADGEKLDLSIRLGALSREQRARLRLAIARLLESHGFRAGAIRLNGEIEPGHRR